MKKYDYFDFMKGKGVTIRKILRESSEGNVTCFVLALHETKEKVKIFTKNKTLVKPNVTLFYAVKDEDVKGNVLLKNGTGPFGIRLS